MISQFYVLTFKTFQSNGLSKYIHYISANSIQRERVTEIGGKRSGGAQEKTDARVSYEYNYRLKAAGASKCSVCM